MPCFVTGSAEGDAKLAAKEAREQMTQNTRLLCGLCSALEADGILKKYKVPGLQAWWKEHKDTDELQKHEHCEFPGCSKKPVAVYEPILNHVACLCRRHFRLSSSFIYVSALDLSALRMTSGNDKKYYRVVRNGKVLNWAGFGWVEEKKATVADFKKYPVVIG